MSADFLAQHDALIRTVGIAPLPGRTILSVTGSDRTEFLQSFTTNDIKKLTTGSGCEAFVTSTQGKTLGDVLVFCSANRFVLDSTPEQAATLISHFNRYVSNEGVQFTDQTAGFQDLLAAGPNRPALLKAVVSADPPAEMLAHIESAIAGHPVTIRRVEYAGPISFFVQTAAADATAVVAALCAAGAVACDPTAVE